MNRKKVLFLVLGLIVLAGGGGGLYYWYENTNYVSTDDARLAGDMYRVMPRISGKINSLKIEAGDTVIENQIVGQQDITNLPGSLLDQATLRAPIGGTVLETLAKAGEVVAPGQPVALIVDKHQLYVSANIEETNVDRLKLGQKVDFTIDTYPGHNFTGKVKEIGQGTASTFSLLPAMNTSGNFTKVTQRIPIKISIDDDQGLNLEPGMSSVIKIHVKGN